MTEPDFSDETIKVHRRQSCGGDVECFVEMPLAWAHELAHWADHDETPSWVRHIVDLVLFAVKDQDRA